MKRAVVAIAAVLGVAACGGGDKHAVSQLPPRLPGCDVQIFHEAPSMRTANIGIVNASCDDRLPEADCLRHFKDEVCKLGGDVVWGVDDPEKDNGRITFSGRAAHIKAAKTEAPKSDAGSL